MGYQELPSVFAIYFSITALMAYLILQYLWPPWCFGLFPILVPLLGGLSTHFLLRNRMRKGLRRYLRDEGVILCIPCGYDLAGNESGVCPECGEAV